MSREPGAGLEAKLKIGISSCLLGEEVRYDGGHKRDEVLNEIFGPHAEWVPVCPELEVGMGVPREPVNLVGTTGSPSTIAMVGVESGKDWTDRMLSWSERKSRSLAKLDLCGYVLKSRSPSCGPSGVRVFDSKGRASDRGTGLFARALVKGHPLLPVEEEGGLADPVRRDDFIVRLFALRRLRALLDGPFDSRRLEAFHAAEEWLLRSRSPRLFRELDALIRRDPSSDVREAYAAVTMRCLGLGSGAGNHAKVLARMAALLQGSVNPSERKALAKAIEAYREGRMPLFVPLALIRRIARVRAARGLARQSYLIPGEREWKLRSAAANASTDHGA